MKISFLLCSVLLASGVAAHAQSPVGTRVITRAQAEKYRWPSLRAVAGAKTDFRVTALQYLLKNQNFSALSLMASLEAAQHAR